MVIAYQGSNLTNGSGGTAEVVIDELILHYFRADVQIGPPQMKTTDKAIHRFTTVNVVSLPVAETIEYMVDFALTSLSLIIVYMYIFQRYLLVLCDIRIHILQ